MRRQCAIEPPQSDSEIILIERPKWTLREDFSPSVRPYSRLRVAPLFQDNGRGLLSAAVTACTAA